MKTKKPLDVIICGDTHGEWKYLNQLISRHRPDVILQVGDFGWWPHFHNKKGLRSRGKKFDQFGVKPQDTKIFWIPGNHENHQDLNEISCSEPYEIQDGVTYCPFGTVIELNGYKILCCGGAESTDKEYRKQGRDWWKEEIISQKEMDNLPETEIDIVISHTIPRLFFEEADWKWYHERYNDPSTFALQLIFTKYHPKKWYSGHFHHYHKQTIQGCEWTSLSMCGIQDTWWVRLKD